jgi:hypothetical protein
LTAEYNEEMQKTSQYHATAYFKRASDFLSAADELFTSDHDRWYPTYFLYTHAAELALKAFLRAHNPEVEYGHKLTDLYEKCRNIGLVIGQDDQTQIGNVVRLLDCANKNQGPRYFINTNVMAELTWTREVVMRLVQAVKAHVEKAEREHPSGVGKPTKLMFIWGKPAPNVQPSTK